MAKRYNYIPSEDYTFDGYIAARPGSYDFPTRFKFHQMFTEKVSPFLQSLERFADKADQRDRACAVEMAKHVKEWDIVDPDGNDVEVSATAMLRLHPALFNRLFRIVITGLDGCDVDPNEASMDKEQNCNDVHDAALANVSAVNVKEENAEGNS